VSDDSPDVPAARSPPGRPVVDQLRAVIDTAPFAVYMLDSDTRVTAWGRGAESLYGWTEEEVLGRPLPTIPDDRVEEFERMRARQARGEEVGGYRTRRRRKDGSLVDVVVRSAAQFDDEGSFTGTVVFASDARNYAPAAELAPERRDEFQALIEASPLAITNLDAEGTVTAWNPAAERLFGWTAAEVIGGQLPHVPEELRDEYEQLRARQGAGETLRGYETRRLRKDGSLVDVEIWSASRDDDDGRFRGSVAFVADVTERKRAERELLDTQKRLEAMQRVTAALAAAQTTEDVAHVMAELGAGALGAQGGWVGLLDEASDTLRAAAVYGYGRDTEAAFGAVPIDARLPVADAARTREPVWLSSMDEFRERYPGAPDVRTALGAFGCLPLLRGRRLLGVAAFQFAERGPISAETRELMETFAAKCAHALERAHLYDEVRHANAELSSAHERLSLAQRGASAGVWSWLPGEGPVYWSPEYRDLYGFEPDAEPSYERWISRIHPEDRGWLEERLTDLFARGIDWEAVFRIVHPLRGVRWIEGRGSVQRDDGGHATRFAGIAIDVTARKRAEDRLARLHELTAALAHAGEPEDVATVILESALAGFGARAGALLVVEDGEVVRPLAVQGLGGAPLGGWPSVPLTLPSPSADAIRTGEIVVCASPGELARRYPQHAAVFAEQGIQAAAYVPLRVHGIVLGSLAIGFDAPRSFDEQDRAFLLTLGREGAASLERAQLFQRERAAREQAERERDRLERLERAMARLAASSREREVAEIVLEEACAAFGARAGGVGIVNEDRNMLELAAIAGFRPGDAFAGTSGVAVDASSPLSEAFRTWRPVIVRSLDELERRFPFSANLFAGAVRSEIAVPLVVGGRPLGAFAVLFSEERAIGADDVELALTFGAQAAQALERARLYEHEHRVAETLQRSLLPAQLPSLPGMSLAASYLPGGAGLQVGGDWYDALELPGGGLALVAGDVVGHGVEAAAAMGQLRNAVRVQLVAGDTPAAVLERVNELVHMTGVGDMATMACAVLAPGGGRLTYAIAGHPPPLLVDPGGRARFLEGGRSVPLGALAHVRFAADDVEVEPGSTIVLYTDGLVERRGEPIDARLRRLQEAAGEAAVLDAEPFVAHLLARLADVGTQADDVAVLALRLEASAGPRLGLELAAEPGSLASLRRSLRRFLEDAGADGEEAFAITVAVGEAAANAVEHAYGPEDATFTVEADAAQGGVRVSVRDGGRWRPPREDGRGYGLGLMEALVDSVEIEKRENGTTVRLEHRLRHGVE
jgi:PAS domain S-box-containing protein